MCGYSAQQMPKPLLGASAAPQGVMLTSSPAEQEHLRKTSPLLRTWHLNTKTIMQSSEEALKTLTALQAQPLSIIRLSEPLLSPSPSHNSPSSLGAVLQAPSPASLEADLNHYKVLPPFSSFLAQVKDFPVLTLFLRRTGPLLQTPLLLPGTSHQREIPPLYRGRSAPDR